MVSFKHLFTSGKADGTDTTLVKPTDWNAEHKVETAGTNVYLGRDGTTPGPVQELPVSSIFPAGIVIAFAGTAGAVPAGWYLCDGTVRPVGDSPALAAIVGATYGGNGTTTFGVPNLLGRVIAGFDPSAGVLPGGNTLGNMIGQATQFFNTSLFGVGVSGGEARFGYPWQHGWGGVWGYAQGATRVFGSTDTQNGSMGVVGGGPAIGSHSHGIDFTVNHGSNFGNTLNFHPGVDGYGDSGARFYGAVYNNADGSPQTRATDTKTIVQPTIVMYYMIKR